MACDCSFCKEHAEIKLMIAKRDTDALIKKVDDLSNRLVCVEEELSVKEAILDGSWPSAPYQLIYSLRKAMSKKYQYDSPAISQEAKEALSSMDKLWKFINSKED